MRRRKRSRRKQSGRAVNEGGRGRPALHFMLDDFCDLLRRENKVERKKWIALHAKAWYLALPRRSDAARYTVSVAHTSVHTDASISTDAVYAPASDEYITFDPANRISRLIDGTGLSGTDFFYDSYGRLTSDSAISYQGAGNPCTGNPPQFSTRCLTWLPEFTLSVVSNS
jgi:hypothetical protein